ncbi:MAG TPA: lytic murein transglycosylase [Cyanobacteria bacterium UBA9971]|nr:lytic murein transglycosylase [Cyanobacteria bacterium UBA9971]
MDTTSIDTTIRRVQEIESRLNSLFGINEAVNNPTEASFGDILDNKINIQEKYFNNNSLNLPNTTTLPDIPEIQGAPKGEILNLIDKYSQKYNIDKNLVKAVVQQESGFNSKAVSSAGAMGLMQLMPSTAKGLGVRNPFDAEQNIAGGTKYLKNLINKYDSVKLGLAAYNAGSGAVQKYGGVPPYKETQNYVKNILNNAGVQ